MTPGNGSSRLVDLRSDTVTQPSEGYKKAMCEAITGDDVWNDCPTATGFEKFMTEECGWASSGGGAVFLPTACQGNLCAILAHCQRGDECIVGEHGHSFFYECGSVSSLAGVQMYPLDMDGGEYNLVKLEQTIRPYNVHFPRTRCILVENSHVGDATDLGYYKQLRKLVDRLNSKRPEADAMRIHCDGARIVNACAKFGFELKEFCQYVDSITICYSKGLGAAAGAILCSRLPGFADMARRWRKATGGGMRQGAGMLSAGCEYVWNHNRKRLLEDHQNARYVYQLIALGQGNNGTDVLAKCKGKMSAEYDEVKGTNMVFLVFVSSSLRSEKEKLDREVAKAVEAGDAGLAAVLKQEAWNRMSAHFELTVKKNNFIIDSGKSKRGTTRLVLHMDVTKADIENFAALVGAFCEETL
ncbi:unnamed protein product [Amoebophrya sp. A25]|nr:unnamed protein product [Amoebophrya sp. A25]|eukprot:GSA25T00001785001.1